MSWDKAVSDLRGFDLSATAIGSRVTGLATDDSDVNVAVTVPIEALARQIEEQTPQQFKIVEKKLPRLLLTHISTRAKVAVITRWSSETHFLRKRDELLQMVVEYDQRAFDFLRLIGDWQRGCAKELPVAEGFPNAYVWRVIGVHFLMTRFSGILLPPLVDNSLTLAAFNTNHSKFKASKKCGDNASELFYDWMKRLIAAETKGLKVNLREPYEESEPGKWCVLDPASGEDLVARLPQQHVAEIAAQAKQTLAKRAALDG
eukprot:TRINITY_DN56812_c0_g1_i1.p1 TRINITY_DN56812_c0_g1~~TRINITY_DN56812_c0_g1_i1.p1  ORF type:complete len:260 (+),score=80.90 TRINITY_DN56812_c0_g1_i1:74-853(+)